MRPISIPPSIVSYWNASPGLDTASKVKLQYQQLQTSTPEISIVIPAYNEEANIVKTLLSLSSNRVSKSIEIIVVNNNSSDNTEALVTACGVTCVNETVQGITKARNTGLSQAQGKYILNADADTLYPENWIEAMTNPLIENDGIALTYGIFSFIPIGSTGRNTYFFYEYATDLVRWFHKYFREESVNVYGFNSAFRKKQGVSVNGFEHPPGTNEDGWLALKLKSKGLGKLQVVKAAPVWTTARRLQIDGGLWKAIWKRIKRNIS